MSPYSRLPNEMEKLDKLTLAVLALGLLLLFGVYAPALSGPFLLDDHSNIPQTKLSQWSWTGLYQVAMSNSSGIFGRPVAVATFALNHQFSDGGTFSFKLTNWLLHALNSILVYLLVYKLTDLMVRHNKLEVSAYQGRIATLLITAMWAFHPLQVSTVMYVVQRMTQFSTLFTLLALLSYLYGRSRLQQGKKALLPMSVGTVVFGSLACLSKETGVLIPLYIFLIEWVVFGFRLENRKMRTSLWIYQSVFVFIPVLLGAVMLLLLLPDLMSGYRAGETGFTLTERLLSQPIVMMEYLSVILMPDISAMNLYHDSTTIQQSVTGPVVLATLGIALMVFCIFISRTKAPMLAMGIGIFLISHLLESTFLPLEMKFEHRNYLAMLGVMLPLGWYLILLLGRLSLRRFTVAGAVLVLGLLSFQTYSRSVEWADDLNFHLISVENDPESYRARTWLAVNLIKKGSNQSAIDQFNLAGELDPETAYPSLGILQARCAAGEFSQSDYERALVKVRTHPVTLDIVTTLLNMSENLQRGFCSRPDRSEVIKLYEVAVENPQRLLQGFAQSAFADHFASLLISDGQLERAMDVYDHAIERDSDNIELMWRYTLKLFQFERYVAARNKLELLQRKSLHKTVAYRKRMNRMLELLDQLQNPPIEIAEDVE